MKNSLLNHIRHAASRILHHWWPVTLCDCSVLDRNEITPFYKRGPIGKIQWVPLLPAVFLKHSCNRSTTLVDSDSPHHLPESFHLGCCTWAFLDTAHPKTAFKWSRAIKFWLSDTSTSIVKGTVWAQAQILRFLSGTLNTRELALGFMKGNAPNRERY